MTLPPPPQLSNKGSFMTPKTAPRNIVAVCACLKNDLTLNAPIVTKVVCFSHLLKYLRSLYGKQCGPIGAVCSGFALFASLLNSSVMLGSYLQQTTSADNIFRCIFFLALSGLMHTLNHELSHIIY